MYTPDETIVAQSSAGGANGLHSIIRMTGLDCFKIIAPLLSLNSSAIKLRQYNWQSIACNISIDNDTAIPCELFVFLGPTSYTTENMIEINLPGSPILAQWVIESILKLGARMAHPGEFTARAFFNGRIDLTQAEAVAQLIHAQSDQQLRAAENLIEGGLFNQTNQLSKSLSELLALVEADIDFSEEDIPFATLNDLQHIINPILETLHCLIEQSLSWEKINHMPRVVMAGLANSGKSTLTNNLLNIDRAICSNIAGTTRDVIAAPLMLSKDECLLLDTAGLGEVVDPLAKETQNLSTDSFKDSDLIIYVIDASSDLNKRNNELKHFNALPTNTNILLVVNKCDLIKGNIDTHCKTLALLYQCDFLPVSAINDNLDILKDTIAKQVSISGAVSSSDLIALSGRQRNALISAYDSLTHASQLLKTPELCELEFLALDLRDSLDYLGEISGQIVSDDVLGIIFGKFCIGK